MVIAKMVERVKKLENRLASVQVNMLESNVTMVSSRYFSIVENTRETYCLKSISLNQISVKNRYPMGMCEEFRCM